MDQIIWTLPNHWKYVSEGGATIVFSYVGPPNPSYDGMVLRLRKATGEKPPALDEDDPIIEFQTKCIERLLPQENLPKLRSVRLEREWLERLGELHENRRPEARQGKDHIDLSRKRAVLATDLVGGDWIAVEIKPKWGFLPSPIHLSEKTKTNKMQTCRFCMHNYMRSQKIQRYVNNYCPLDLFSGNADRIRKAVDCLWEAWVHSNGNMNNLKVFARGETVRPNQIECLPGDGVIRASNPDHMEQTFKDALSDALLNTSILMTISKLQRNLDTLDIEGLSKLWRETELDHQSAHEPVPTPLGVSSAHHPVQDPGISDWTGFLDIFQSSQAAEMDHSQPQVENMRYYMLAYLLSATFKDCSIIVRLDPDDQLMTRIHPIAVIDLDPKSLTRLRKWEQLDREIVLSYTPVIQKVCVDAR